MKNKEKSLEESKNLEIYHDQLQTHENNFKAWKKEKVEIVNTAIKSTK